MWDPATASEFTSDMLATEHIFYGSLMQPIYNVMSHVVVAYK